MCWDVTEYHAEERFNSIVSKALCNIWSAEILVVQYQASN
jgi:hypothetical protein